ncbi:UDP-glycosyltransferase UGT5-like isoform X1 [Bacillus rossius redtenbacheri]|uniref:UDP-glycosyltransferase UGT5-like isoform X1 n=2 Tax=Bacillus rossius redtenbacheri TaxID=93214 RepID=UPI002FDE8081
MAGWSRWLLLALVAQALGRAHTARILGVYPMPSRSHHAVINSLLKELAARGHEVTVISSFPPEKPLANYTHVDVDVDVKKLLGKINTFDFGKMNSFSNVLQIVAFGEVLSKYTFENEKVQEIIKSKKYQFDVVILEDFGNEALAGIAHVFNAPLIYFSSAVGFVWTNDFIGNPGCYAYIPNIFSGYSDHMTFTERVHNTLHNLFSELYYHLIFIPKQDYLMRKYLQEIVDLPHLSEINTKTSLVLANALPGINYLQPVLPNYIQVGGIHISPPKQLPQDLQAFLDNASEGVIYFSMGSFLKSADFPKHIQESFLKAFGKLKQKVLWKFEVNNLPGQPSNVVIKNWFPQNDILAHPNTKLFITHGGLLSNQEAVYHGKTLLGIPILGDQRLNMRNTVRLGYGLILEMSNITDTSVEWALNEALNNPRYAKRAKMVSRIFRDQPQTSKDKAVFWTEYVIRHKGAPHLRSAALDLAWYQYLLLDVVAVILLVIFTFISIVIFSCRKLFGSKRSKPVSLKKKIK